MKQEILMDLLNHPDQMVSGQSLCQQYNVSRTAIWKAIQSLKKDGYQIEAIPHKGYRLLKDADKLNAARIQQTIDTNVLVFDTIDSTNTYAKELLAKNKISHGTMIVANTQTAGRGRQGHTFYSPADTGLYLSIVLLPNAAVEKVLKTTLAAAVATCEAIKDVTFIQPQIKWVNDLFVGQQKICGILTEANANFETQRVESIIVGIGINCKPMAFPKELQSIAGSLDYSDIDRNQLAANIWQHFMEWENHLDDEALIDAYRKHSLLIGKKISYQKQHQNQSGTVLDINSDGDLVVQSTKGIQILHSGEVTIQKW